MNEKDTDLFESVSFLKFGTPFNSSKKMSHRNYAYN